MHFFQNSNSLEKRKQLNEGLPMSWLWPPSSSSPSLFSLHYIYSGLPTVPQTHWSHFCLRDFEFAIPSAWSVLPLGCAQSLLPTSLRSLNLTFLPWTNVYNLLVKKFSSYRPSWLYIFSSTVIPPDILYFLLVCLSWSPVSPRRTLIGLCYLLFAIISPWPRTASGHSRHFINICQKKR